MNQNPGEEIWGGIRHEMVETQLVKRGIRDPVVLQAMHKVPRHIFVPDHLLEESYDDGPLPIGSGQTISQPYIVAYMTEILHLKTQDRVLEVGTGSGYQAAILAEIVSEVFTIEAVSSLYNDSKDRLQALGYQNIHFRKGDGSEGWPEKSPFDKIMVTAATDRIPEPLISQLKEGGRLIIPLGDFTQILLLGIKRQGRLHTSETIPVRFVPLIKGQEKKQGG